MRKWNKKLNESISFQISISNLSKVKLNRFLSFVFTKCTTRCFSSSFSFFFFLFFMALLAVLSRRLTSVNDKTRPNVLMRCPPRLAKNLFYYLHFFWLLHLHMSPARCSFLSFIWFTLEIRRKKIQKKRGRKINVGTYFFIILTRINYYSCYNLILNVF